MDKLKKAREKRERKAATRGASTYARNNTEANRRREFLARLNACKAHALRLITGGVSDDDDRFREVSRQVNELEAWKAEDEAERDPAA